MFNSKLKTISIFTLVYFVFIVVLAYFFGSSTYDPLGSAALFGNYGIQVSKPVGGLIQYKLNHPFYTPAILMHDNNVNGNDIFSHLEMGNVYLISIGFWFIVSIALGLITTYFIVKPKD